MSEKKHLFKKLYYTYRTKGQYIVNGTINGNIERSISVLVGPKGIINGNVHVKYANIEGTIHGNLIADDYIELAPSAKITGEIQAKEILTVSPSDSSNQANE